MKAKVLAALDAVPGSYSPDRVVADPELNSCFLQECRRLGLTGSDADLNRQLLNLRKAGGLRGRRSQRTSSTNDDQFRFAAEMAARFLERRSEVSLDEIICDPVMAREFDELAARISPGFTSLEYRWAALNLRKARKFQPEITARLVQPERVCSFRVSEMELHRVPTEPGLYLFFNRDCALYVGEAADLQNRIRKHLDHSDNKGLARWLWDQGPEELHLEIQVLSNQIATRARRALELELIRSRSPLFNVKR